jgi:hypothetical protein
MLKHQSKLKRKSFNELKTLFIESDKSRKLALLTKSMQGWRSLHVE